MKKLIALLAVLCMMFSLAACGGSSAPAPAATEAPAAEAPAEEAPAEEAPAEEPAEEAPAASGDYKLGMGVVVSTDSSKDELAQVDATVAAVVLDGEGKIVQCRLDVAQNKMEVVGGEVVTGAEYPTKMEKKEAYGMKGVSGISAEWYEQAMGFEAFVVGKTAAEVEGMETAVNDSGHNVSVDEALLATCTMDITAFKEAVVKACNDEKGQTFAADGAFTLGVAAISTDEESTSATEDEDGVVKMYTEFGAAVVGADGVIISALNDAIQPQIKVDVDGAITDTVFKGTKRELGPDYGMVAYGAAIAEWDAQSKAFSDYAAGKTAEELRGIETTTNEEGHAVAVDETLFASVTMAVDGMTNVIAEAADYAR